MTGTKRKYRGLLFLPVLLCLCVLAVSCKKQEEDWQKTLHEAGKTLHITYDGNGGLFDKYEKLDVYIAPGDPIPQVENTPKLNNPVLNGYFVGAWYYASYDADGKLVLSDRAVDFSDCKVTEDTVIAPKWEQNFELRFLAGDGEIAMSYRVKPGDSYSAPTSLPQRDGYTFMGSYLLSEADCPTGDRRVSTPLSYETILASDGDGDRVVTLCPEFLQNEGGVPWVIVSDPNDLYEGGNYYLVADLDFSGETVTMDEWSYRFLMKDGLIEGNGHTIKGLHITASANKKDLSYGIFPAGSVKTVRNLTFEGCTFEVNFARFSGPEYHVAFFAGDGEALDLTDVTFTDCVLKVGYPTDRPPQISSLICNEDAVITRDGETIAPDAEIDGIRIDRN